jgi:hypothetical protein
MRPPALLALLALAPLAACNAPARVEMDPASVRLYAPGQSLDVHARPVGKNGKPMPQSACAWSSSDDRVATVKGPRNQATVTATGPGSAVVTCRIGGISAEVPVSVRFVARIEVPAQRVELKMLDQPEPVALDVRALDGEGKPLPGRVVLTRCEDENVCRGDNRGQLWAVGPGETRVAIEVDEARATVSARVVDARTAEGRPRKVKGNPMLDYEKAVKALGR